MKESVRRAEHAAYMRDYLRNNPDKRQADNARRKAYYYRDRSAGIKKASEWAATNPERRREINREYARRKRASTPKKPRVLLTPEERLRRRRERNKRYAAANRQNNIERSRAWVAANKERHSAKAREWRQANRKHISAHMLNRLRTDLNFRLKHRLRGRIVKALKGSSKSATTCQLLGCTIASFRIYIESKFEIGMTWENYGSVWEIDHEIPCALFDLTREDHQRRCFHFSNLQPLFRLDNKHKGAKLPAEITDFP